MPYGLVCCTSCQVHPGELGGIFAGNAGGKRGPTVLHRRTRGRTAVRQYTVDAGRTHDQRLQVGPYLLYIDSILR